MPKRNVESEIMLIPRGSEETTYIHAVTETYGREHHTEGQDKTLEEELLVEIHKES